MALSGREIRGRVFKGNCSALSCAQNLAIEFNGELIANTSVQKVDTSFVIQLQINVVTGQITDSLLEVCENCQTSVLALQNGLCQKLLRSMHPFKRHSQLFARPKNPTQGFKHWHYTHEGTGSHKWKLLGTTPLGFQAPVGEKIRIQITKRGYEPRLCTQSARMTALLAIS